MRIRKNALNTLIISALVALVALVLTLLGMGMKFNFGAAAVMDYKALFLAILAAAAVSFLFGWLRYNLAGALTLGIAVVHDQLLSLALCAILSLVFGLSAYLPAFLLCGVAATYCFTVPWLREARLQLRSASSRDMTRERAAALAFEKTRPLCIFALAAAVLLLVAFLVSGNAAMAGNLLPLFTGLVSAALSARLMTPSLWATFAFGRGSRK